MPDHSPGLQPAADSYVRRKSSELRKLLPKSPNKAVNVVKHLWNQLYKSPRKHRLMDTMWQNDKQMGKYMYCLGKYKYRKDAKKLNDTVDKMRTQYKSLRSACRQTSMQWSQFHNYTTLNKRKIEIRKYIRKLEREDIESIGQFFESDATTFPLPDKKFAGKRFMKKSLRKSCKMYNLLAKTTRKVSESTFRKYQPKFIKLQGKIPYRQSCCEVCQNFEFLMASASKFLKGVPNTIDACIDSSMCSYTTYFPKISCALRDCQECGVDKLKNKLLHLNADILEDNRKKFLIKQWETKREMIKGTGKYRNYMHWRHDRLSNRDLINAYVKSLSSISAHSFFAAWNFHQYLVCKNNIEKGQILIVHDYAQNYLCKHQDEIQA